MKAWWGRLSLRAKLAGAFGLMAAGALVFLLALQARTLGVASLKQGKILEASVAVLAAFFIGGWFVAGWCLEVISRLGTRINERHPAKNLPVELEGLAGLLRREAQRRDHLLAELRRFTADASHELRTPLTALRTLGEVALREAHPDTRMLRDSIGGMLEEAQKMNRLIERLLLLARVESDGLPVNIQNLFLADALAEIRESLLPLAEEKRQKLELDCPSELRALADSDLLRHIVLNLGQNAIRYGPSHSTVRWQVRPGETSATVWIEVRDEGPGVPSSHREHIFERFNRVDPARARAEGGIGLGLCIAKAAAERLKGTIELLDRGPGTGACFRVRLPTEECTSGAS
jgi:signal transduction histidine kinase